MRRSTSKRNVPANAMKTLPELGVDDTTTRTPDVETVRNKVEKRIREVGDGELDFAPEFGKLVRTRLRVAIDAAPEVPSSPEDVSVECGSFKSEAEKVSCCSAATELAEERSTIEDPALRTGISDQNSESAQIETLTFSGGRDRSKATLSSESCEGESNNLESTAEVRPMAEANSHHQSSTSEMPPESEIEEFFSAAEKDLHDAFTKKYNFDIVKGVPLEGRYEWFRVNP